MRWPGVIGIPRLEVIDAAKSALFHYWNCEGECGKARESMAKLAMVCGYTDRAVDDDIRAALSQVSGGDMKEKENSK